MKKQCFHRSKYCSSESQTKATIEVEMCYGIICGAWLIPWTNYQMKCSECLPIHSTVPSGDSDLCFSFIPISLAASDRSPRWLDNDILYTRFPKEVNHGHSGFVYISPSQTVRTPKMQGLWKTVSQKALNPHKRSVCCKCHKLFGLDSLALRRYTIDPRFPA